MLQTLYIARQNAAKRPGYESVFDVSDTKAFVDCVSDVTRYNA